MDLEVVSSIEGGETIVVLPNTMQKIIISNYWHPLRFGLLIAHEVSIIECRKAQGLSTECHFLQEHHHYFRLLHLHHGLSIFHAAFVHQVQRLYIFQSLVCLHIHLGPLLQFQVEADVPLMT